MHRWEDFSMEILELLKLVTQKEGASMPKVVHPEYLDFLCRSKDRQIIKVVHGAQHCGKTELFALYHDWLKQNGVATEQIISIKFSTSADGEQTHYRTLHDRIKAQLLAGKMNYVFLDEIQHVPQFEKVVDSLFLQKNVDLYIAGPNPHFTPDKLAMLFGGRYIELRMPPPSL